MNVSCGTFGSSLFITLFIVACYAYLKYLAIPVFFYQIYTVLKQAFECFENVITKNVVFFR